MKPSERVIEIGTEFTRVGHYRKAENDWPLSTEKTLRVFILALTAYLDEEHERRAKWERMVEARSGWRLTDDD